MTVPISETAKVSLALSCVAALHRSFGLTRSSQQQQSLLTCAAAVLDTTVPFPDLKKEFAKQEADQLEFLIANRARIGAVPKSLWRPLKIDPNLLPQADYSGLRASLRLLKDDHSTLVVSWRIASEWVRPIWVTHAGLAVECAEFKQLAQAARGSLASPA